MQRKKMLSVEGRQAEQQKAAAAAGENTCPCPTCCCPHLQHHYPLLLIILIGFACSLVLPSQLPSQWFCLLLPQNPLFGHQWPLHPFFGDDIKHGTLNRAVPDKFASPAAAAAAAVGGP